MTEQAVTRAEIIDSLVDNTILSRKEASLLLEEVIDSIYDGLQKDKHVGIVRFGTFRVREKNSRIGRNPKTGEQAEISARKVVSFKPSPLLRRRVAASTKRE